MNWNSTHTSSGVGAYDTCMCPHVPNHMYHFITKKRNFIKKFTKKVKGKNTKCKVQNVISYMNYTIAIK